MTAVDQPLPAQPERVRNRPRQQRRGWLRDAPLVAPAALLVTCFLVAPLVLAMYFSLTDWDGFSVNPPWIGLANYRAVFADPQVWRSVRVTGVISVAGTTLVTGLALTLAALIDRPGRLSSLFRAVFFYPHVIAAIAIGFTWNSLLSRQGPVNYLLGLVNIGPLPFLAHPRWALWSLVGVLVWQTSALSLILFLGAMRGVPGDLYDAASIDGATAFQQFRWVTLPSIAGTVTVSIIIQLAAYLRVYELVLALTSGGPAGSTETIAYQILSVAYLNNQLGRGAAEAVLLFAVTVVLAVVLLIRRRAKDENL